MSSRNLDLEYEDYLERRNHENPKPPKKFEPIDDEKEKTKTEIGDYGLPKNEYRMQGYDEKPANDIGTDAIASVRSLRNNLRVMSLEHRDKDEPVKSHLCQSACDDLTKTEKKLVEMSHQRSSAAMRGDTKQVEKIGKDMDQVKSDAIRNAYSDLMIDDKSMKAFGVNSKWTPDKNPLPKDDWRPMTPMKPRKRATTPTRDRSRASSRQSIRSMNNNERPITQEKNRENKPIEEEKAKPIKKNQRLANIGYLPESLPVESPLPGGSTVQDDPYKMPTFVGRCPHCQLTENGLGRNGGMEDHFARYCKVMTSCKFCLKVTMVSQLTDHLIYRCEFLKGTMKACNNCGLAVEKEDNGHPMCRGRKPPSGAQWCPLCTIAVDDNEKSWQEHLVKECYNNPRRHGAEKDPWEIKQEQDNILRKNKEKEDRQREIAQEEARMREMKAEKKKKDKVSKQTVYPGKMIDADKLVVALQEIQDRKKAEKKKKLVDIEKNKE